MTGSHWLPWKQDRDVALSRCKGTASESALHSFFAIEANLRCGVCHLAEKDQGATEICSCSHRGCPIFCKDPRSAASQVPCEQLQTLHWIEFWGVILLVVLTSNSEPGSQSLLLST